jgi:hypothetical protein
MSGSPADLATRISSGLSMGLNGLGIFVCPAASDVLAANPLELLEGVIRNLEGATDERVPSPLRENVTTALHRIRPVAVASGPWTPAKNRLVAEAAEELLRGMGLFPNHEGPCPIHGEECPPSSNARAGQD